MNKEFKVGDVVILVKVHYLNNTAIILAKEKHLFKIKGLWGKDKVDLQSISTLIKLTAYEENIRHATLKEQYLREGNSVVFDGEGYLVSGDKLIGLKNGFDIDDFCDNLLTVTDRKPITKVFNSPFGKFEDKIDVNLVFATVLWEREEVKDND